MDILVEHARGSGVIPAGSYRAVVLEESGRINVRDYSHLDSARRYADDAASESGDHPPVAIVVNHRFEVVHRGRPYFMG